MGHFCGRPASRRALREAARESAVLRRGSPRRAGLNARRPRRQDAGVGTRDRPTERGVRPGAPPQCEDTMTETISFRLNGRAVRIETDGERKLLWVLRGDLGLTGTKYGCGEAQCGSCTVVVDGEAVRACRTPVKDARGKDVVTIEGLERGGKLHPLQEAFVEHGGMQCGFCTPGMLMSAYALLLRTPKPTRTQIVAALDDNLCRCANYKRILEAVASAAAAR